jgi:hypothetical protein
MVTPERFEFELAERLHMLHCEMMARMPASELMRWQMLTKAQAEEQKPKGKGKATTE